MSKGKEGLIGAAWVLNIIGSPLTFLTHLIFKLKYFRGLYKQYFLISFLYLLQYQLIAVFFYKFDKDKIVLKSIVFIAIIILIISVTGYLNWKITIGI